MSGPRRFTWALAGALTTVAAAPALAAVDLTIADHAAVPGQSGVAVPVAITSDATPPPRKPQNK